jgi:hypothetical protein
MIGPRLTRKQAKKPAWLGADKIRSRRLELRMSRRRSLRPTLVDEVLLPEGRSPNRELVSAGLAWWRRRYAPGDTILAQLEAGESDEMWSVERSAWGGAVTCEGISRD